MKNYPQTIPHGIMFHHFHGGHHPKGQGSISQEEFDRILNTIGVQRFLSPSEWLERLEKKKLRDGDLCLTFDDGLLCQKELALPVLQNYHLQAFWFVYSSVFEGELEKLEIYRLFRIRYFEDIDDFYNLFFNKACYSTQVIDGYQEKIKERMRQFPFYTLNDVRFRILRDEILGKEKYETVMDGMLREYGCSKPALARNLWMSDEDLKFLSGQGHQMGLHSYSHPTRLGDLSYEEQLEEYQKNYDHLKTVCNQRPTAMSHPCNSYNEDTLTILKELGVRLGFRSNQFPKIEGSVLNPNALEMAREDHANIMREISHG